MQALDTVAMFNSIPSSYHHTQRGPWFLLVYAISTLALIAAFVVRDNVAIAISFVFSAFALSVVAACFHHLTVSDEGDCLLIKFGPLPLFQRRVRYGDIQNVVASQTALLYGWGIHLIPFKGWVWNIWGWDCVVIEFRSGRKLWLGTDEPTELCEFLKEKIM